MSQVLTPPKMDQYEQAALAWAQEFGYEGSDLPIGGHDSDTCPLALATGMVVCCAYAYDSRTTQKHPLPTLVSAFVTGFDSGEYPSLDLDRQGE